MERSIFTQLSTSEQESLSGGNDKHRKDEYYFDYDYWDCYKKWYKGDDYWYCYKKDGDYDKGGY